MKSMSFGLPKYLFLICLLLNGTSSIFSQESVIKYVNPFIGTTKTKSYSRWGSDGGTYPGAVAPFGYIQLSPETRVYPSGGYDFRDSVIYYFSCINHKSGYPEGSSGNIHILPLSDTTDFQPGTYFRPFSHKQETSLPGLYSVVLSDDGTEINATSSVRTGLLKIIFPEGSTPFIFIGNTGKITLRSDSLIEGRLFNTVIALSRKAESVTRISGGCIVKFSPSHADKNVLLVKIGASQISHEASLKSINTDLPGWDFESFRKRNSEKWSDALKVIEIEDSSSVNKTIFYTALYHTMLLPWIISDSDGNYRGSDWKVHISKGGSRYGMFSPWDTFRSLHPLLCLLMPERQNEMVLSLLDAYEQTGRLPGGPMTGNHTIPLIVDSWMKGIRGYDSLLAFNAMKSMLLKSESLPDFAQYSEAGYVSAEYAESVTRTVEYAYNDWTLALFSRDVMREDTEYRRLIKRSYNFRNLVDPLSLFLVPRKGNSFVSESSGFGYKEGDKWSYSLFVPHNPASLVNLTGGRKAFSEKLDFALENKIPFDNEPVLHVPYLFNYSDAAWLTQKWVRKIMHEKYTDLPSGLPGNDDLGSMSSWFVFSALGLYPLCPGKPVYDIGSPLFKKAKINLAGDKKLVIYTRNNSPENIYVGSLTVNGSDYKQSQIPHSVLAAGGELIFKMSNNPDNKYSAGKECSIPSETNCSSLFKILDFHCNKKTAIPGERCMVRFSAKNSGSFGGKVVRLFVDGREYLTKSILADSGIVISDSMECRFFQVGIRRFSIDDLEEKEIEIGKNGTNPGENIEISDLVIDPVFRAGEKRKIFYSVRNTGGYSGTFENDVFVDDSVAVSDKILLGPGELKRMTAEINILKSGIHPIRIGTKSVIVKTYYSNSDSRIIDICFDNLKSVTRVADRSGFQNDAIIISEKSTAFQTKKGFKTGINCYAEIENSSSTSISGNKFTIMAWILQSSEKKGLSDIITQGDYNVIQTDGNNTLTFFAGGWGRGSCTVKLSKEWAGKWNHIAGVCDGTILRIYINGYEAAKVDTGEDANLLTSAKWTIGRNEEFPDSRFFTGKIDSFRVFVEPLTEDEIKSEMRIDSPLK